MAARSGARSAIEATRFTSTTPHATSKHPSPSATATARASRSAAPLQETPEQRVRRLRAAHLAAQNARISKFDRVVGGSRKFFDGAQRVTIFTLVGFTLLAGLVTTYSVVDMVRYNRKRRLEFLEAKKKIEADELATARLAFINGTATEEQITLVEEANLKAQQSGFKLPPLLGPASTQVPSSTTASAAAPAAGQPRSTANIPIVAAEIGSTTSSSSSNGTTKPAKAHRTWREWLFSSLKREEEGEDLGSSEERLGWESLSEEDDAAGVRESDLVRAIEEKKEYVREKAREAVDHEKENQRHGGPLDRQGIEPNVAAPKKRSWRPC